MAWIAKRRIPVGGEVREPGEPVPEAEGWKNRQAWIDANRIEWKDDGAADAAAPSSSSASDPDGESGGDKPSGSDSDSSPEPEGFYCAECDKSFSSANGLKRHNTRVHG